MRNDEWKGRWLGVDRASRVRAMVNKGKETITVSLTWLGEPHGHIDDGRVVLTHPEAIALRDWLNAEFPAGVYNGTPGNAPETVTCEALP